LKDQHLRNLVASALQPAEQATSLSTLDLQWDSNAERINNNPNFRFIENCEVPAS